LVPEGSAKLCREQLNPDAEESGKEAFMSQCNIA
jgi:hypothetical protein